MALSKGEFYFLSNWDNLPGSVIPLGREHIKVIRPVTEEDVIQDLGKARTDEIKSGVGPEYKYWCMARKTADPNLN